MKRHQYTKSISSVRLFERGIYGRFTEGYETADLQEAQVLLAALS